MVRVGLLFIALSAGAALLAAQSAPNMLPEAQGQEMSQKYVVPAHTRVPLVLVNSVSTKTSQIGDQVYLETSFPILAGGRIVIPEGSYVTGTITEVKRPGKVKGRGELYLRFDVLTLRNGVSRDFRGMVSATDGSQNDTAKKEGTIQGDTSRGQDVGTIATPAETGGIIGAAAGGVKGAGIGAGAGAAAGMMAVLLTRGPDVRLLRGSSLEMQTDRDLTFYADEINFLGSAPPAALPQAPPKSGGGGNPLEKSPLPRPF